MGDNLPYVDLGTDESGTPYTVKQVDAGYDRTCAILNNDQVKCWGDNNYAESGYGDFNERGDEANEMGNNLPFVDLGTGRSAKQIFAYYVHTCAILDNDALKCWGSNNDGEIGLATDDFIVGNNTPYYNKYLCSDDATVPLYSITAEPAGDICEFGGYRYEYGTDSNGNEVLDSDEISLDSDYLCNRRDVNAVYAISSFAANSQQVCGTSAGLHLTHDFDSDGDGQLAQGDVNMMGDALPEIDFGSSAAVVDVVQGDDHTCALLADTTLKCWGINEYGQLGLDNTINNFGDGANEIPAAQTEVDLGTDKYAVAIAGAYNFTCALLNTDEIKCWGYDDDYGTLGVIDYYDTTIGDGNPAPEMGDALQAVPVFVSDES
jgi:alpha-tubulin suppressor-like RCC1 family protein